MIDAGLGSFSIHSLKEYVKSPFYASTILQAAKKYQIDASKILIPGLFFEEFLENLQEILGISGVNAGIMYVDEYDKTSKKYKIGEQVTHGEIVEAADWYDTYVAGDNNDNEENLRKNFDKYVDRFSLSKKGYAESARAISDPPARGEKGLRYIYVRFYINKQIKPDRVIANKGAPFFTDVPRRPTGPAYSARQTKGLGTGVYRDFDGIPDAYEPDDVVAAPLKTSFNPAIGMHDIQNQIIALLLDDLDPATVNNPNLSSTNIDDISFEDFYKKDNPYYLGGYTSCLAIPLSSEYGNPHEFGPNQIECIANKVEKIRAVNRSARSFSKGQRVMCHYIGNEWIVTELGDPVESEPVKTTVGRWSFAKFITNTNTHFQMDGANKTNWLPWKPFEIMRILRYRYYNVRGGMNQSPQAEVDELEAEGLSPKVAMIHPDIIQTSIYDQYKLAAGLIYTNNQKDGNYEIDGFTPLFFGPVFDDGHKAKILQDGMVEFRPTYLTDPDINTTIPADSKISIDGRDNNGSLPAEVAINGPWSGESSPVDSYDGLWDLVEGYLNDLDIAVPMELISSVIQNYNYLKPFTDEFPDGDPNQIQSFAWPPVNPSKLTFYSLTPQFAFADDMNATTAKLTVGRKGRAFRTQAEAIAAARIDADGNNTCINGLGEALTRGPDKPDSIWSGTATQLADVEEGIYDPAFIFDAHRGKKWPLYDNYSKSMISEASLGLNTQVDYFTATDSDGAGAEVCGVITARNKISRPQGGNLNIYADFHFGQGGTKIFGGTRVDGFNIFNMQINQSATNPFGIQIARWGGRDNNIWDFGCTALHVKIYDWWPEDQTLFIAPYFTVLHFNPGVQGQEPEMQTKLFLRDKDGNLDFSTEYFYDPDTGQYTDSDGNKAPEEQDGESVFIESVDYQEPETDVDMIVPTSADAGGATNIVGQKVDKFSQRLRPDNFSKVNTSRRGLLLTGNNEYEIVDGATVQVDGGIAFYEQSTVGLDSTTMIIEDGGFGFEDGRYECGTRGAVLQVVTEGEGSITDASIFADNNTDPNLTINGMESELRGEGYKNDDFPTTITITNPNDEGRDARITFENGVIYRQIKYDRAPRLVAGGHNGKILHPSTHKEGQEKSVGNARTEIPISDNSEYHKYPGEYECYYYFHNDVTHVGEKLDIGSAVGGALSADVQYISINVT